MRLLQAIQQPFELSNLAQGALDCSMTKPHHITYSISLSLSSSYTKMMMTLFVNLQCSILLGQLDVQHSKGLEALQTTR